MASGSGAKKSKSLLAVLLCIPLAFIVYYLISYSSQAVSIGNVKQVTVQVPGGSETVFDKREDVDFFVDLLNGAKTISSPMRDVSDETPVNIICTRSDKSITYRLYPTLNLTGCLLIGPAPDNKLYVLESEAAGKLLLRDEFDYMYSKNFLPRLYVARGESKEEVLPLESNWKYKKADGNEYVFTPQEYAKGDETYRIYKGNENEREYRRNLKRIRAHAAEIDALDGQSILVKNNGIGELAWTIALVHRDMQVYAVEADEDRYLIASHTSYIPNNLHFILDGQELPSCDYNIDNQTFLK